jgi:hypothetical protein
MKLDEKIIPLCSSKPDGLIHTFLQGVRPREFGMSVQGIFFVKDSNFKTIHDYIEEFMETAKLQLEVSTNARSLHNSLNRNMNSHNRGDREIEKKFSGNKPLQYNNSAEKNAYQKPFFNNKNLPNAKFGGNPINNIDEEEQDVFSSDEEQQFESSENFDAPQKDQLKNDESIDNVEEYDVIGNVNEDFLAEVSKTSDHLPLKPQTSLVWVTLKSC